MAKKRKRVIHRSAAYGSFDVDKFIFTDLHTQKGFYYVKIKDGTEIRKDKLDKMREVAHRNIERLFENAMFKPSLRPGGRAVEMRPYYNGEPQHVSAKQVSAKQIVEVGYAMFTYIGDAIQSGEKIAINTATFAITKLK